MNYVLQNLQRELADELRHKKDAEDALRDIEKNGSNAAYYESDCNAFEASKALACERIPQLQQAIELILKEVWIKKESEDAFPY